MNLPTGFNPDDQVRKVCHLIKVLCSVASNICLGQGWKDSAQLLENTDIKVSS